jgi:acetate kinase
MARVSGDPPLEDTGRTLTVLALNSGSSSLKFGLYRASATAIAAVLSGELVGVGDAESEFHAWDSNGKRICSETMIRPSQGGAIKRIDRLLIETGQPRPEAIGHRIVHGGPNLTRHCLIDRAVLDQIEAATAFAPSHIPSALAVFHSTRAHFADLPQVACFDTAFHADMPDIARILPIPRALQADGIRRYGFHGLSCESILHQLGDNAPDRIIIAHLGHGASVTAIKAGRSVDTSMGLTPTGGVIMGTRSGDIDPGVLLYLLREKGFDASTLAKLVDRQSGLLGVSGVSGDMRGLNDASASNPAAGLAVDMFRASVRKQIAAMITVLDGADLIVFTGGIGENDVAARAAICDGLAWIGVRLDADRNRAGANPLQGETSRCAVLVLPSREDDQIARHVHALANHVKPAESPARLA